MPSQTMPEVLARDVLTDTPDAGHAALSRSGAPRALETSAMEVRVSDGADPIWDTQLAGFDDALLDQSELLARLTWGQERLSKLVVTRAGAPVAAAQVVLFHLPKMQAGPGIAHVKFGPLWRPAGEVADLRNLEFVLRALIAEYAHARGLCLTVVPPADPETTPDMVWSLEALGFRQARPLAEPRHYVVDLSLGEEEQRKSLAQKWRYNLKKAEKNPIEVTIAEGPEAVATFMDLSRRMRARKQFREHTWVDRFAAHDAAIPDTLKPVVVFAMHEGRPTAGAVVARIGKTATYLFGASDERALKLKAGYVLQWWIVNWLSRSGVRWYDLDGDSGDPGLRQFKSGLAGRAGHAFALPGEFDYCVSPMSRLAAAGLQQVRRMRNAAAAFGDRLASG